MKRILFLVTLAMGTICASALPAAADYPPKGVDDTVVLPQAINAPAGTAFTGSTVIPLILLAVALLVVGGALVFASRRVRTASHS